MKSILYQLSKYQQPKEEKLIDVTTRDPNEKTIDFKYLAKLFCVEEKELHKIPITKWCDVLYPVELLAAHCLHFYNEAFCDDTIKSFLREQDPVVYRETLMLAVDDVTKRLILFRMLVATLTQGTAPFEHLPLSLAPEIYSYLGIEGSVSRNSAYNMLEAAARSASHEQNIIGRLGYMSIWPGLVNGTPEVILKRLSVSAIT